MATVKGVRCYLISILFAFLSNAWPFLFLVLLLPPYYGHSLTQHRLQSGEEGHISQEKRESTAGKEEIRPCWVQNLGLQPETQPL